MEQFHQDRPQVAPQLMEKQQIYRRPRSRSKTASRPVELEPAPRRAAQAAMVVDPPEIDRRTQKSHRSSSTQELVKEMSRMAQVNATQEKQIEELQNRNAVLQRKLDAIQEVLKW